MSEGKKYDGEKPRMHLLPPKSMVEIAKVLTFGAEKYDEHNWRKLENLQNRYTSGTLRHIFAHNDGEQLDEESGLCFALGGGADPSNTESKSMTKGTSQD